MSTPVTLLLVLHIGLERSINKQRTYFYVYCCVSFIFSSQAHCGGLMNMLSHHINDCFPSLSLHCGVCNQSSYWTFFTRLYLFIFRERGWRRKRETSMCDASISFFSYTGQLGPNPQPRPRIQPVTFCFMGNASTTEPRQSAPLLTGHFTECCGRYPNS